MRRREFIQAATMATLGARLGAQQTVALKALMFDTFGTVVDYRSSIITEGRALGNAKGLSVDWEKFADAWRAAYAPALNRVRTGELPWTTLDTLHRMMLDKVLADFGVRGLTEHDIDQLNGVWHRLTPWPDAVSGLTRLKKKFIIGPLSNGNVRLMTDMAKHAGLPWDVILGAELARHYKPDKEVYLTAADLLNLKPQEIMMVAAHQDDLRAAKALGFKTAFVRRPKEGPSGDHRPVEPDWDLVVNDFNELATRLRT